LIDDANDEWWRRSEHCENSFLEGDRCPQIRDGQDDVIEQVH
jgi:hypothetical protein